MALIILLSVFIGYGTYTRKKIYDQIDHLETQKVNIMNKPLTDEIAKVKALEMIGETEKKFEVWREEWDVIVTQQLPNMEEKLFDAEDAADKYRFKKARGILSDTRKSIFHVEEKVGEISLEINEFVESEELNRQEIGELKNQYKELRKHLLTHYRALGPLVESFEKQLENVSEKFTSYHEETENGNHLSARTYILQLDEDIRKLQYELEVMPELLYQLQSAIPETMKELKEGLQQMKDQGFRIDQLGVEKELEVIDYAYEIVKEKVHDVQIEDAREEINQMNAKIEELYDTLEAEVVAKQEVTIQSETVKQEVAEIGNEIHQLNEETNVVRLSYQIEQENIDLQERLETSFDKLEKRIGTIFHAMDEKHQSYTSVKEMLENVTKQLTELREMTEVYQEKLQNLRKDELEAVEKIQEFRKRLMDAKKEVHRNNLPGLPESFYSSMSDAEIKLQTVTNKLNDKPLQMAEVLHRLIEAEEAIDEVYTRTFDMIDRARLAEHLIQYGNRYRSQYIAVAVKLAEAEQSFRTFHYEEALEHAAEAIQSVEPGKLQEIEESYKPLQKV
ncbi:septation ring formation regulator EzrA [Pseudalkalibacillus berkeleyi]|uniref:Septation ring formation regulator EzrA n=1 Tax=Pseudalkalibacillus berkeleyi TaxID=1069813 RepID=A0ABS9GZR3_9BACL|nr:septation ring formation regulator EzrA [Pseudalkalibacillus berkeleyi]MCF6138238.1 septation ring formation regulator EzrA [Pseudalkalibacillus berkeleyi]